jgi:hypothetical protein
MDDKSAESSMPLNDHERRRDALLITGETAAIRLGNSFGRPSERD